MRGSIHAMAPKYKKDQVPQSLSLSVNGNSHTKAWHERGPFVPGKVCIMEAFLAFTLILPCDSNGFIKVIDLRESSSLHHYKRD